MSKLSYHIIPHKMKDIAESPSSCILESVETDLEDLKDTAYTDEDSVMTVCDNFITIYSYPLWFRKFGSK